MRPNVACVLGLLVLFCCAFAQTQSAPGAMLYEQPSNQWFEAASTQVTISDDSQWVLFGRWGRPVHLVSLRSGKEDSERLKTGSGTADKAAFCGPGNVVRVAQDAWTLPQELGLAALPADAVFRCSSDGTAIAYFRAGKPEELFIGQSQKTYQMPGRITGMVFAPDKSVLYVLAFRTDGASSLLRIALATGEQSTLTDDLDAPPSYSSIATSSDLHTLYLPLASPGKPDNLQRHQPDAPRWLRIYALDVATGARQVVADPSEQDDFSPTFAGGELFWARNVIHSAVALLPAAGGESKELIADAQLPLWSPDGQRISYVIGGWRRADWALNLDAAVIRVNPRGEVVSKPSVIVEGFHEDFSAAWSPDGKWIAYHSHRSKAPVVDYASPDATDDVYLRRADDLHAPELRLTDFGWETGSAFWSPDGTKLLFSSWVKGAPGIDKLWVLTLDPKTGQVLRTDRLPLPAEIRSAQWAAWSPDGKEIAIEDHRGGQDRSLWIARADGSHAQKLLDYKGTTYGGLDWSHDGKTIIYSGLAGDRMQLFSVPRAGGVPRQLSQDAGNLLHPRVSPDGRWIACTRLIQSQQIWRRHWNLGRAR